MIRQPIMTNIDFSSHTMSALAFLVGLFFVVIGTVVSRADMQAIGILFTITGVFGSVIIKNLERPKPDPRSQL